MKNKSQAFVNLRKKLSLLILLITVLSTSSFTTTTIKSSLENRNTCFVEEENINNNIKEVVFRNSLEENAMSPATFTSLGAYGSGGTGFKTTNISELVVSNNMNLERDELYGSNSDANNVETLILKADEVDAASFDLYDMTIYSFGSQSDYSGTSLTLKDKDGSIIKTMTGTTSLGQTKISIGSFFTTNNSLPVIGVAEIIIEVHNSSPDSFTITSIDIRNTVAPSSNTTPTVTTTAASGITATTATLGGNITDNGGATVTDRGIVYNTTGTPTTANTKVQIGSGDGSFSNEITGLTANTEYYVRAYAINSEGTSYGSEESFTTPACTMTASITSQTNIACHGEATGSLTATPANGASPYTYLWNDGSAQTTATASGLSAGTYEVTVTDNNGCMATASATITQPTALSTSITATPVSFNGGNDGTIDLTITGGTTPYGFDWSHTATTEDLTGLTAGTYSVTITDANGCTATASAEVTEPAPITPDANNILYVDKDATGSGSGTTWTDAVNDLQTAIDAATSGVRIFVKKGEYILSSSIEMKEGVKIYGSFAGIETSLSARNLSNFSNNAANATILNGNSSRRVIYNNFPSGIPMISASVLDGFVITGGANTDKGGGIYNSYASPSLTNLIISGNTAQGGNGNGGNGGNGFGGGMYNSDANPTLTNVTISGNTAQGGSAAAFSSPGHGFGGGVYNNNANPTLTNVTISGNTAQGGGGGGQGYGGGMYNNNATPTLTNTILLGNTASSSAAGIFNSSSSSTTITYSLVQGEAADATNHNLDGTITATDVFTDFSGGDYSLKNGAAVINAGNNSLYPGTIATDKDLAGNPRLSRSTIDMGAYEYQIPCLVPTNFATANLTVESVDLSWTAGEDETQWEILYGEDGFDPDTEGTTLADNDGDIGETLEGLDPNTAYDVYVRAVCGVDDESDWLGPESFTTPACTMTASVTSQTNVACYGNSTGSLTVIPADGTPPYTYLWNDGSAQTTATASGLSAGTWTCTVTDNNGCTATASATITQPAALNLTPASQTNIACYGGSTGAATVNVATGGVGGYTYNWTPGNPIGDGTTSVSGLSAGTWTCTVTDANGCAATQSFTITQPIALSASITATPVSFNGGNDGTIDLTITGGTTPYGFEWGNTATTEDLTGLTAGTYNVTVTDANGCTITTSAEVTEPAPFIPDANNILYVDKDATGISSGNSWENAITELADALVWAKINEDANWENTPLKIYVSIGTYKPLYSPEDSNFGTDQERDNSFLMVKNVQVYGGFDPSNNINTLNDERILPSTGTNGTILSADVNNDDGDDFTNNSENLTRVIVSSSDAGKALLNGFTISGANGEYNDDITVNGNPIYQCSGAGIYNSISSPNYENLLVTRNYNTESGGGMFSYQSSPTLRNIIFKNNKAKDGGAIASQDNSNPKLINVALIGNTATNIGGAIYNVTNSSPTFVNSTVANNSDTNGSNGMHNADTSNPNVHNCIVWGGITGSYQAQNSIIEGNDDDTNGNIDATDISVLDIFNAPTNGDYSLKVGSFVVVNKGDNTLYSNVNGNLTLIDDVDLAGNARLFDGCPTVDKIDMGAYELQEGSPVLSASATATPVSCNGGNNGTIDLTVTGGIAPYDFEWSNTAATEDLTGLTAGTYSVTITDANECTTTTSVTITQPTALSASITATPVSCNGGNNGTADLTITGGIAPYNFEWTNDATTEDMIGLTAGTYSVTITDANGCTTTTSAEVSEPTALSASIVATPVSCNDGNNGTADLTVIGGIAPYSFEWSNTATTEDVTGLTAGTYSVTITDANGCTATTSAEVNEPTALSASIVTTPVNCNGGNNGTADLTVTGGIAPYSFEWSNDTSTEDLTGLTAGTYSVTITDANGCTATTSAEVSEPTVLSASIVTTPVSCNGGNNGTVDLTVTGGIAPYNFEWTNDATTEDLTGLTAGTYSVTITDANGCTATASVAIVVEDSTKPTVVCQDITVQLDTNGNVSITTDDIDNGSSDNCGIASMSISQNTFNNTNLGDNMVTLTVEDAAGNTDICTAIVTVNEAPSTIPDIAAIKIGSISFDNPPNTINYLMDCNNGATSIEIEVLAKANTTVIPRNLFTIETPKPGIYKQTITVTPQNGNSSKTYEIVINKQFDFDGIVIQKFNNTLLVNNNPESNGGYKFVNYQWYKNGVAIGTGQYYSTGPNREDSLDPNASYSVEMTTEDGDVLSTCIGSIEHTQSYNISVTPNPVTAGSYVEVYADLPPNDLKGMQLSLHSLSGQYIKKMETQQQLTNFIIPTGTQTGVYVFYCKTTTGMVKHFKIIVK